MCWISLRLVHFEARAYEYFSDTALAVSVDIEVVKRIYISGGERNNTKFSKIKFLNEIFEYYLYVFALVNFWENKLMNKTSHEDSITIVLNLKFNFIKYEYNN